MNLSSDAGVDPLLVRLFRARPSRRQAYHRLPPWGEAAAAWFPPQDGPRSIGLAVRGPETVSQRCV